MNKGDLVWFTDEDNNKHLVILLNRFLANRQTYEKAKIFFNNETRYCLLSNLESTLNNPQK
tara:strand:- start:707 stop:889 length:183 start_codon:yes stop_codon:yes gene_type:complete